MYLYLTKDCTHHFERELRNHPMGEFHLHFFYFLIGRGFLNIVQHESGENSLQSPGKVSQISFYLYINFINLKLK